MIGAGGVCDPGWLSTNIETLNILEERDWARLFQPATIDAILSEHVWEHLTEREGRQAASLCFRYLRPEGYCRVAVPDGLFPDSAYIQAVRPGGDLQGRHAHKTLYTYRTLGELFQAQGFMVTFYEYFDENGAFNYADWDPEGGKIHRSKRFDPRNAGGMLKYTSLVMDATKPLA